MGWKGKEIPGAAWYFPSEERGRNRDSISATDFALAAELSFLEIYSSTNDSIVLYLLNIRSLIDKLEISIKVRGHMIALCIHLSNVDV